MSLVQSPVIASTVEEAYEHPSSPSTSPATATTTRNQARPRPPTSEADLAALSLAARASLDSYQARFCIAHLARPGDFVAWANLTHSRNGAGRVTAILEDEEGLPVLVVDDVAVAWRWIWPPAGPWHLQPGDDVQVKLRGVWTATTVVRVEGGRAMPAIVVDSSECPALAGEWALSQVRLPA